MSVRFTEYYRKDDGIVGWLKVEKGDGRTLFSITTSSQGPVLFSGVKKDRERSELERFRKTAEAMGFERAQ